MRWKFVIDESPVESAERDAVKQRIAEWWSAFVKRTDDLDALFSNKAEWDLPAWMHKHLNAVSPELMWEFGPGIFGGNRLVITPESNRNLRPMVEAILASAPKIAGWEFYGHRLPEDFGQASRNVDARGGHSLAAMRFQLIPDRFNRVDVRCLVTTHYPEENMKATGYVGLESLLGEELVDRWIGGIECELVPKFPTDAVPGIELLDTTRRMIARLVDKLRAKRWAGSPEEFKWAVLSMEPEAAEDYPRRTDQFTQISAYPNIHECLFNGIPFDSVRFSRCGEMFAFVKIDGAEALPDWGFENRESIENALRAGLESVGLGTVIGGGNGLRYCYVDLALVDVMRAVPIIREVLARGGVSTRSWLFFSDADLSSEWIGIYSDSPSPPL